MKRWNRWIAAASKAAMTAALVAAFGVGEAGAQDAGPREGAPSPERKVERRRGRPGLARMRKHRAAAPGRALARIEWTDDQVRVALDKARAAEPIVAQWRRDAAAKMVERRDAARSAAPGTERKSDRAERRGEKRAFRQRLAADLAPLARDLVATLTPEQRARIEGFAAARGRTVSEDRLVRLVGRRLARPMTIPLLEARLAR